MKGKFGRGGDKNVGGIELIQTESQILFPATPHFLFRSAVAVLYLSFLAVSVQRPIIVRNIYIKVRYHKKETRFVIGNLSNSLFRCYALVCLDAVQTETVTSGWVTSAVLGFFFINPLLNRDLLGGWISILK